MDNPIQRQALSRDLARRNQLASHDELRVIDRALLRLEQRRRGHGDEHRWERRLPTGPGDVDRAFHLARPAPSRGVVQTLCRGSWPIGDLVETQDNVPLVERCAACWRCAAQHDPLEFALIDALGELLAEDMEREQLHEAARREMLGELASAAPEADAAPTPAAVLVRTTTERGKRIVCVPRAATPSASGTLQLNAGETKPAGEDAYGDPEGTVCATVDERMAMAEDAGSYATLEVIE